MTVGQAAVAAPMADLVARLRGTRDAGVEFILRHVSADGTPEGARDNHYYRIPWALAVAGEREAAGAVLSWIERNALTPEGDLQPGAQEPFVERWSSYPLAIIATGAWHLERYDTALRIMDVLRDFQDPGTGGSLAERPEVRRTSRSDLFPTAQLGMTALTCGRREVADGCYRWIAALYEAQPGLPGRLYSGMDARGLMTEIPPGLEFELLTDLGEPRQAFYNPGIAAAFLARYFMCTGVERARELGRAFLRLSAAATERQYDHAESKQVCKFGWGSALMAEVDPAGDHLRWAMRMGEWFAEGQLADGRWQNSPFLTPDPSDADDVEITAEFVLHVTTILTALGGHERGAIAHRM